VTRANAERQREPSAAVTVELRPRLQSAGIALDP
jgi:hypothetical protein